MDVHKEIVKKASKILGKEITVYYYIVNRVFVGDDNMIYSYANTKILEESIEGFSVVLVELVNRGWVKISSDDTIEVGKKVGRINELYIFNPSKDLSSGLTKAIEKLWKTHTPVSRFRSVSEKHYSTLTEIAAIQSPSYKEYAEFFQAAIYLTFVTTPREWNGRDFGQLKNFAVLYEPKVAMEMILHYVTHSNDFGLDMPNPGSLLYLRDKVFAATFKLKAVNAREELREDLTSEEF